MLIKIPYFQSANQQAHCFINPARVLIVAPHHEVGTWVIYMEGSFQLRVDADIAQQVTEACMKEANT